jgi:hypothetical protein
VRVERAKRKTKTRRLQARTKTKKCAPRPSLRLRSTIVSETLAAAGQKGQKTQKSQKGVRKDEKGQKGIPALESDDDETQRDPLHLLVHLRIDSNHDMGSTYAILTWTSLIRGSIFAITGCSASFVHPETT